jgi:hypothetical protein
LAASTSKQSQRLKGNRALRRASSNNIAVLGNIHAFSGKGEEVQKIPLKLPQLEEQRLFYSYYRALIYMGFNQ